MEIKSAFKGKHSLDGSIAKRKARLVERDFLQRVDLDYSDVYALVARLGTVKLVVALANAKKLSMFHFDVKNWCLLLNLQVL